ncbi:MAG: 8-oxo-dGTP diphosphatase MutT [Thiolinea sp.]
MLNTAADNDDEQWLHVVAAVIPDESDRILLARRPANKHQGGKWEFPGGKVESAESARTALARELQEELGISADSDRMQAFTEIRHRYPDKNIFLDVWLVREFSGEPRGCEGQEVCWFPKSDLSKLDFPAANSPIIDKLLS